MEKVLAHADEAKRTELCLKIQRCTSHIGWRESILLLGALRSWIFPTRRFVWNMDAPIRKFCVLVQSRLDDRSFSCLSWKIVIYSKAVKFA